MKSSRHSSSGVLRVFTKKSVLAASCIGVTILALLAITIGSHLASQRQATSLLQSSDNGHASPARPTDKVDSEPVKPEAPPEPPSPPRSIQQPAAPTTQPKPTPSSCNLDVNKLTKEYKQKVRQQRELLDKRLNYVVGSNIAINYINTYNQSVSNLYNQYEQLAASHGCSLRERPPAPLPKTYER